MALMDIALSDLLTCPRCGPQHGLILLPEEVRDRRVLGGVLGCANCRERYRIEGGTADLAPGAGEQEGSGEHEAGEHEGSGGSARGSGEPDGAEGDSVLGVAGEAEVGVRLAALLGLTEGGGTVVLAGHGGRVARAAEALLEVGVDVAVVVVGEALEASGTGGGISRLRAAGGVPLRDRSARGVALTGSWSARVEEGSRLVTSGGRLVLDPSPSDGRSRVEAVGLRVLLEEGSVLVAGRGR